MAEQWYKSSYRRNLVDMHIDDWDDRFLSRLDPVDYVEKLKVARVQSAMIYANSHVGHCNWPTESGHMHSGLRGRDFFGEMVQRCHDAGMSIITYYSLIFNTLAYDEHPSWRIIDRHGEGSRDVPAKPGRYGKVCPNSQEYRLFVRTQMLELLAGYDFEGVYYDMTFWPAACYCVSCRERFMHETGKEIPRDTDWDDPVWNEFQRRREAWITEFAEYTTGIVKDHSNDISVNHNDASLTLPWQWGVPIDRVAHEDYCAGDLYGGFVEQSFICKFYRAMTKGMPFEYQTSRCEPDLQEHTVCKSEATLMTHAMLALAHGGAFLFIDAIDPIGTLNPAVYERMGSVFAHTQALEPYAHGELVMDVALYYSLNAKGKENGYAGDIRARGRQPMTRHLDSLVGATRALREAHIPFGVATLNRMDELPATVTLIVPNAERFRDEEVVAIKRFVERGGTVVLTGATVTSNLGQSLGILSNGMTHEDFTYIAPTSEGQRFFVDTNESYPLSVRSSQPICDAEPTDEVLGTITLPHTDPADRAFASIHSNPPGRSTNNSAIVRRRLGAGEVLWITSALESGELEVHRATFVNLIGALRTQPYSVRLHAHRSAEAVVRHQRSERRFIVTLVNVQDEAPPVPLTNLRVTIDLPAPALAQVFALPDRAPLSAEASGTSVSFAVQRLEIYAAFLVEYATQQEEES
jgi:hypothetical protein